MTKRYTVECDTPDRGRTTYSECWGAGAKRGRVLSEHDTLALAVIACDGNPGLTVASVVPWIWDRKLGRLATYDEIVVAQRD